MRAVFLCSSSTAVFRSYLLRTSVCLDETSLFRFPPPPSSKWPLPSGFAIQYWYYSSLPTNRTQTATLTTLLKQSFCFRRCGKQPPTQTASDPFNPHRTAGALPVCLCVRCGMRSFWMSRNAYTKVELHAWLGNTTWCFCTDDFSSLQAA